MKFDSEKNRIFISVSEFTSISRRGISPTLPRDEEEPSTALAGGTKDEKQRLTFDFSVSGYDFTLFGYQDGTENEKITLTREVRESLSRIKKANLAAIRGEAYVLAYMLAKKTNKKYVNIETVFVSQQDGNFVKKTENVSFSKLLTFFDKCAVAVGIFAKPECERVKERLPSMKSLSFPYKERRPGQSDFIKAVYRNIARGTSLIAAAPTGTGKTVSALYPALRALGDGKVSKVFYLTPKTTTGDAARDCLNLMAEGGAKIRAVRLLAKEKTCQNGLLCRHAAGSCNNATENKLPEGVMKLYSLEKTVVELKDIQGVAREVGVCPHELSLAYSEICDVVICDVNYLFDPSSYIRRYFTEGGDFAFLIDEAHNLPERAREMFSADLSLAELKSTLNGEFIGPLSDLRIKGGEFIEALENMLYSLVKDELNEDKDGNRRGAAQLSEPPVELYSILDTLLKLTENHLSALQKNTDEDSLIAKSTLRDFSRKLDKAYGTLLCFDKDFRFFVFYDNGEIKFKLFCLDTARLISRATQKGRAAIFFSATLSPMSYYRAAFGNDRTSEIIDLPSPFDSSQLSVSIMDKISTRYSERERTLPAVCRVIAATLSAKRGKYMVFAPSFEYCRMIGESFAGLYPKIRVMIQSAQMTRSEKEEFLAAFSKSDSSYLVGFCVLGGIYSEGIDLSGDSLIGAVVVGIGMPSLSYERECMAQYFDERFDSGKLFAYVYPGMNRVLQAAGRVIRRDDDRGVIVLIDDRFDDPVYKKIIPSLWQEMRYINDAKALNERLKSFWEK
jgi:Rad3-related DNA helicase